MKETFTNRHNLPTAIYKLLTKGRYNLSDEPLGDYSATTLCNPIQLTTLKNRYPDKLKVFDAIDQFWMLMGSLSHLILEEMGAENGLIEKRFYATVLGKTISGQVDHYQDGVISDYKTCKVFKVVKASFEEWENQQNIYRFLAEKNGYPVHSIRIFAFILDWTQTNSYQKNYPECPIVEIPLKLWEPKEIEAYIENRVNALNVAANLSDKDLAHYYPCSDRDQWCDTKDHALFKKDKQEGRALKVFKTQEEADAYTPKRDEVILPRKSARTRCFRYCPASTCCLQHRRLCLEEGSPIDDTPTIF